MYEKRGYKFYQRTLLGKPVDYVVISPFGMTYHDSNKSNLLSGLRTKTRAQAAKMPDNQLINWSVCKKLGFCNEGITAFCDDFGLSAKKTYHAKEIERAVRSKIDLVAPYLAELKTLANAVNYPVNFA